VLPNSLIFANRFLGFIITSLVSIIMMIYLYGRERAIRDRIEMESRLNLREVAQGLELRATTDPLTGLYYRLKFNEALGARDGALEAQSGRVGLLRDHLPELLQSITSKVTPWRGSANVTLPAPRMRRTGADSSIVASSPARSNCE
jgi:hypothetical protein